MLYKDPHDRCFAEVKPFCAKAQRRYRNVRQINEYYSKEINESLENFMTLVEPVLILITGVFMFFMIAQFVLPVFSLLGRL